MKPCMYRPGFPLWNCFGLRIVYSQFCFDPTSWQTCSLTLSHFVCLEMIHDIHDMRQKTAEVNSKLKLEACPSGVIWFPPVRQRHNPALLNPHFHRTVQLCNMWISTQRTDGHLCLPSPCHLHRALSCWWITAAMEKLIQGTGRQQPSVSPREAQLSYPGLHLRSNVNSCTWLLPGELQILLQESFSQVVAAHARGGAGRIWFEPQAVSLKSFHAQFNSLHSGEGDLFQENPIQNDQGGLITRGKWQCYGPARQ